MNNIALQIEGKIDELKGKLKQKYNNLTDVDLAYEKGMDDEFIGKLKQKLGKTKSEMEQEISEMLDS